MFQAYVHFHSLSFSIFTPILRGSISVKDLIQLHVTNTHRQCLIKYDVYFPYIIRSLEWAIQGCYRDPDAYLSALSLKLVALILMDIRQLFYFQTLLSTSSMEEEKEQRQKAPAELGLPCYSLLSRDFCTHLILQNSVTQQPLSAGEMEN